MTLNSNAEALGNVEYTFIVIAPSTTQARTGSTWYDPINGLNRTKQYTNAKRFEIELLYI